MVKEAFDSHRTAEELVKMAMFGQDQAYTVCFIS